MGHRDDLMQRAVDGELPAPDAARLAGYLQSHPEAGEELDRLQGVDAALRRIEAINPPPELRQDVMRQIRLQAAIRQERVAADWFASFLGVLRGSRPAFQLGLGFALGVLVLSPFILRHAPTAIDPGHAAGTLLNPSSQPSSHLAISGPGCSGDLIRSEVAGGSLFELRLSSEQPVEAVIDLGRPLALASLESEPPARGAVELAGGRLTLHHEGEATYRFRLAGGLAGKTPVKVQITSQGQIIFEEAAP